MIDAAVIGASASGLYTATLLAEQGFEVEVFERARRIAPASRTLIVTASLRDYVGATCDSAVLNEVHSFELFANGKVASFPLAEPDLVIERASVIGSLCRSAEAAGVQVHTGSRFIGAAPAQGGLELQLGDAGPGRRARHLIGADGARSRVARLFGWGPLPTVPLLQARVRLPAGMPSDTTRVWFRPQDTPYFFWLIPDSPTTGALGLIGTDRGSVQRRLGAFLAEKGLRPLSFQSAQVPEYAGWISPSKRLGGAAAVHLVGDAAAQVKVSTVGGLVTGFRGAIGVAQTIATGRRGSELRRLRRELNVHLMVKRVLHRFEQEHYVDLLELLEGVSARRLGRHSRDQAPSLVMQVLLSRPSIALLVARAALGERNGQTHHHELLSGAHQPQWDPDRAIQDPRTLQAGDAASPT